MDDDAAAETVDFDDWVATRGPALLRFAFLVTGTQQAAEDAAQSALATACSRWERIGRLHDRDAYVRRMVVNAHRSWWRKFGRRESPVEHVFSSAPYSADPATVVPHADAVWRLCQSLPTRQRASVVLRFYEDLTYREIAGILGCPEATVRSHIHRALAALRTALAKQENHDE